MADFIAKLDTYVLDIISIDDASKKGLGVYEYPFRDGAKLDHMGMHARQFRIKCAFEGVRYSEWQDFETHVNEDRVCDFVHPKAGLIRGRTSDVAVRHDDRVAFAEVDFTFIEQFWGDEVMAAPSVIPQVEKEYVSGFTAMVDAAIAEMEAMLGITQMMDIVDTVIDTSQSIISQVRSVNSTVRKYLSKIDDALEKIDHLAAGIEQSSESVLSTIQIPSTIPGHIVGSVARCCERYAQSLSAVTPVDLATSFVSRMIEAKSAAPLLSNHFTVMGALQVGAVVAIMYDADMQMRGTLSRVELARAFDNEGNYIRRDEPPEVYTVDELERSLYSVRQQIQAAIDVDRTNMALRRMSVALLHHVERIRIEREHVVIRDVTEAPLHVLCMRHGLPYTYADRLIRLNGSLRNPTFAAGELRFYA